MPRFEVPDMHRRRPVPVWLKMMLLVAVLFGIAIFRCSRSAESEKLVIHDVSVEESSNISAKVIFSIRNRVDRLYGKKQVRIVLEDQLGREYASRLVAVDIQPLSDRKYVFVLSEFHFTPPADVVASPVVEFYYPGILGD